jgi:hypothetical protein
VKRERICAEPGCTTRLSTYNPDRLCWIHSSPRPLHPGHTYDLTNITAPVRKERQR